MTHLFKILLLLKDSGATIGQEHIKHQPKVKNFNKRFESLVMGI